MMWWWNGGNGGWPWWGWLGIVFMVVFWALVIWGAVMLGRALLRSERWTAPSRPPGAEEMLAERFARGEIDAEEYQRRLDVLRGRSHTGSPAD